NGPIAIARRHIEQEPEPLPVEAGRGVEDLFADALLKDPRRRPQNGTAFADAIAAVRRGHDSLPAGTPLRVRNRPRPSRKSIPTTAMPVSETPVVDRVRRRLTKLRGK